MKILKATRFYQMGLSINIRSISSQQKSQQCQQNSIHSTKCNHFKISPFFPNSSIKTIRLQTFGDWPESAKKNPKQLADAGFFCNQADDRFICFSCGYTNSTKWCTRGNPWKVHALYCRGDCDYLTMVKGSNYITSVRTDYSNRRSCAIFKQGQREKLKEQNRIVATIKNDKILNP